MLISSGRERLRLQMVTWGVRRSGSLPATGRTNRAEELKLCAIARHGYSSSPRLVPGLGGALAAELVLAERIEIDGDSIAVLDATPTGDELVDDLLAGIDDEPPGAVHLPVWIAGVGVGASPHIHDSLIHKGLVGIDADGPSWQYLVRRPEHYRISDAGLEPSRRVEALLTGQREADPRGAVLAGLAWVCGLVDGLVPVERRDVARVRAASLIDRSSLPGSVHDAIESTLAATEIAALSTQRATQAA
jgi:Golgi phosphoprotein 3 (GPP34)